LDSEGKRWILSQSMFLTDDVFEINGDLVPTIGNTKSVDIKDLDNAVLLDFIVDKGKGGTSSRGMDDNDFENGSINSKPGFGNGNDIIFDDNNSGWFSDSGFGSLVVVGIGRGAVTLISTGSGNLPLPGGPIVLPPIHPDGDIVLVEIDNINGGWKITQIPNPTSPAEPPATSPAEPPATSPEEPPKESPENEDQGNSEDDVTDSDGNGDSSGGKDDDIEEQSFGGTGFGKGCTINLPFFPSLPGLWGDGTWGSAAPLK